jgi:hypothetical protein
VAALLADGHADPAAQNSDVLRCAARYGHTAALRIAAARANEPALTALLADGRADPAADGSAALQFADNLDIVSALLADGRANPAARDSFVLRRAVATENVTIVRALLADGRADPAACSSGALLNAALQDNTAILHALLADGRADLDTLDGQPLQPPAWYLVEAAARWRRRKHWIASGHHRAACDRVPCGVCARVP